MPRPPVLVPLLLLAACGPATPDAADRRSATGRRTAVAASDGNLIFCAAGTQPLARTCTLETFGEAGGRDLVLRHADGAFRRLRIADDGRGVVAADGADAARVRIVTPDEIEVAIGGQRYRLPATVKGDGK